MKIKGCSQLQEIMTFKVCIHVHWLMNGSAQDHLNKMNIVISDVNERISTPRDWLYGATQVDGMWMKSLVRAQALVKARKGPVIEFKSLFLFFVFSLPSRQEFFPLLSCGQSSSSNQRVNHTIYPACLLDTHPIVIIIPALQHWRVKVKGWRHWLLFVRGKLKNTEKLKWFYQLAYSF